ncbi:unnamed protein product, partial [Ixodes persulcatus]
AGALPAPAHRAHPPVRPGAADHGVPRGALRRHGGPDPGGLDGPVARRSGQQCPRAAPPRLLRGRRPRRPEAGVAVPAGPLRPGQHGRGAGRARRQRPGLVREHAVRVAGRRGHRAPARQGGQLPSQALLREHHQRDPPHRPQGRPPEQRGVRGGEQRGGLPERAPGGDGTPGGGRALAPSRRGRGFAQRLFHARGHAAAPEPPPPHAG